MLKLITTLLDVLAVLAVAAGLGLFVAQWIGWLGLAVFGLVVLGASQVAILLGAKS